MNKDWKKRSGNKELTDSLGIGTCIYPPEAPKQSLPEYAAVSRAGEPVAASGEYVVSAPVLPFGFSSDEDWQTLLNSALGRTPSGKDAHGEEETKLETLIQAIVEHSRDLLPLLRLLREKSAGNDRLADIVNILQDRLNLGINAACSLAPREMEVLELAARGESNANIARILNLQTVTVAKALSRAYRKLDAKNRTDAVHKWLLLRDMPR